MNVVFRVAFRECNTLWCLCSKDAILLVFFLVMFQKCVVVVVAVTNAKMSQRPSMAKRTLVRISSFGSPPISNRWFNKRCPWRLLPEEMACLPRPPKECTAETSIAMQTSWRNMLCWTLCVYVCFGCEAIKQVGDLEGGVVETLDDCFEKLWERFHEQALNDNNEKKQSSKKSTSRHGWWRWLLVSKIKRHQNSTFCSIVKDF